MNRRKRNVGDYWKRKKEPQRRRQTFFQCLDFDFLTRPNNVASIHGLMSQMFESFELRRVDSWTGVFIV